jgi:zinc and cadmium transporter
MNSSDSSALALSVLIGTVFSGVGSVWMAWFFVQAVLAKYTQHLLSLAAGALLATAFLHLLPEAFESTANPRNLFATLLAGILFFFLLDKAELWHHGHEHHHEHGHDHDHSHTHSNTDPISGGWAVLFGDSLHCFGDGVLVAAAFTANFHVGLVASLAVWTHEVPHHMGDLVVLRSSSTNPKSAVIKLSLAGAVTVIGGLVGLFLLVGHESALPYLLALASSSYIYVSLADLIPQLQKRLTAKETLAQLIWLATGMLMVVLTSQLG